MNFGLRTILLLAAVVLFVIGLFTDVHQGDFITLGLAAFAAAFLAEALGMADRTFGRTDTTA